jgi:hypothetical protein
MPKAKLRQTTSDRSNMLASPRKSRNAFIGTWPYPASVFANFRTAAAAMSNRLICVVRKMHNVGRQLGIIPEEMRNPGTEIQRFPEHRRRRYVTPAEMPRLAAAIRLCVFSNRG